MFARTPFKSTELRNKLLAVDPLNKDHVIKGPTRFSETSFPVGNLAKPSMKDLEFIEELKQLMEKEEVLKDEDELAALQARLRKRFPVDACNKARKNWTPTGSSRTTAGWKICSHLWKQIERHPSAAV
ncbi:hypothetical protein OIU79_013183 [Salix purpurea]|uniref:Uncharacterized protein n=1 Tax=Salix purpurea TaxID=77065 RepID=A0A9Q0Q4Y8_SALPP|nr:hypothetical protein OIU79_013183 [Salix purpurea]